MHVIGHITVLWPHN